MHIAGFGENDWSPFWPEIVTVVMFVFAGGAGVGVVGGVAELLPP
jgi:hypothetical protein